MTNKIISLLVAVLAASFCAMAQFAVGDWRLYSSYVGDNITAVAEGNRWVYYLSSGYLFRLDKDTQENESLNVINDLSDMNISQVYYNSDRDYLVIVYKNANIDIILSDGAVVNMPEIKDAVLTQGKTINDVTFASGRIYLATDFGYVVIDDNKFVVKESHIYGTPMTSVAQVGDWLLLSTANRFYYGDADKYHEQLEAFQTVEFHSNCRFRPINDSTFFCLTGTTYVTLLRPTEDDALTFDDDKLFGYKTTQLQATKGGWLLYVADIQQCFKTDELGRNVESVECDGEPCSANRDGDGQPWAAGINGLHLVGSQNYFLPNALSYGKPFWMAYNRNKGLLYVSSATANGFVAGREATYINTFDGTRWNDVTPEDAPVHGTYWIEFMPDDPDTYFIDSWREGLLKVSNDEIVLKYDTLNSPIRYKGSVNFGTMHSISRLDRNGNLWVVQSQENSDHPVMVLPAAKTKLSQVTAEDWITPVVDNLYSGYSQLASFLCTKRGTQDIKVFTDGNMERPLIMWKTDDVQSVNPQQATFSSLYDQDGELVSWTNIKCLTEDQNGLVWMGTTEGICYFNPAKAFDNSDFRVVRPKVPRNDGTGYADRLMDGIQVNDIAVDGANRKWIATQSSGLFLVNADGSQIIRKFNTTNSPLASNMVYRVCCNPTNNSVYITTPVGMYEYFSDSSPAESSYDNLFAYPNPVRPDYGGDVTITGMMEGSLIKIADASGNVIRQLKSTGGMATWDLCDEGGTRVGTGVYLVLCSQSSGSGKAAVTKIAVIR